MGEFELKGVANKRGVFKFITLALVSSKKMINISLHRQGYGSFIILASIQDFAAHLAIKYEQTANV